jgi:hypothetical protein
MRAINGASAPSVAAKPRLVARIATLAALEIVQISSAALRRFQRVARVTGLEPATSGVTGRRSNQLSYTRL